MKKSTSSLCSVDINPKSCDEFKTMYARHVLGCNLAAPIACEVPTNTAQPSKEQASQHVKNITVRMRKTR